MKRTSPLRPQLEEKKSGGRRGSSVGRERGRPRGSSPLLAGLPGTDALQPLSQLAASSPRPDLSEGNVNALVATYTSHLYLGNEPSPLLLA